MKRNLCLHNSLTYLLLGAVAVGSVLIAPGSARAQVPETKVVTVQGQGINQQGALRDALRNALEQGAGVMIASYSETQDYELIRDTIFSKAEGLVTDYDVLEQGQGAGGLYFCRIRATVKRDAVATAWGEVQNVLNQIGRPKVMVYIAETIDGQNDTSSVLENKIEERLIKIGFDVYDSGHLDEVRRREAAHAAKKGDKTKMASLAKGFGAQLFIMGHANANRAENVAPSGVRLVMYNCDVSVKAFYTDTGKLLASETIPNTRGGARGFTEYSRQAAKMAIYNASEPLIEKMYDTIMKSWSAQISAGGEISLEVTGFPNAGKAFLIKKKLRGLPKVSAVNGPQYTDGHAVYRINANMTAEQMMEYLVSEEWMSLIEVSDVTLNRIQAKWVGG